MKKPIQLNRIHILDPKNIKNIFSENIQFKIYQIERNNGF